MSYFHVAYVLWYAKRVGDQPSLGRLLDLHEAVVPEVLQWEHVRLNVLFECAQPRNSEAAEAMDAEFRLRIFLERSSVFFVLVGVDSRGFLE